MQLNFFSLKGCIISLNELKKSRIYGICDKKNHDAEEEKKNIEEKKKKKKDDDFLDSKQKKRKIKNYDNKKKNLYYYSTPSVTQIFVLLHPSLANTVFDQCDYVIKSRKRDLSIRVIFC